MKSFPGTRSLSALACLLVLFSTVGALLSKEVVLRNKDGKSLSARMLTRDGDKLTVLREADKKQFVLDVTQLDDASRAEVEAWIKAGGGLSERFEIEVRSGKTRRKSGAEDFDDKNVNIEPLIVVKNPLPGINTRAARVTALFLGRPINERNAYYVFSSESFDLASLPGGAQQAFQMKKISRNYDDRGYAKFGARYLGWVVLIHDPEDERVIFCQSVPVPLAQKFGGRFLTLKPGGTYDDNLKVIENIIVYSD